MSVDIEEIKKTASPKENRLFIYDEITLMLGGNGFDEADLVMVG